MDFTLANVEAPREMSHAAYSCMSSEHSLSADRLPYVDILA